MKMGFYSGCIVNVQEVPSDNASVLIKVLADLKSIVDSTPDRTGDELYVRIWDIEELAHDVFSIGEPVRSKVGGLTGKVSGYEPHTNRVLILSDKIGNYRDKRDRYAYKTSELEKYNPDDYELVPGARYRINGSIKLIAVDSVFSSTEVMLVNMRGAVIYDGIPKKASRKELKKYGINSIKYMGAMAM